MGPLVVDGTYIWFGNYEPFLPKSSVVLIIGLDSLLFIRPVQTVKAVMSSIVTVILVQNQRINLIDCEV